MADKSYFEKELVLDCPFPVPVYDANITYKSVRKPSGVAYILLDLISNASVMNDALTDVLVQFGIPSDLHDLFADELVSLISSEVVASVKYGAVDVKKSFSAVRIGDFRLTDLGKKLFSEKEIPVGDAKVLSCKVYRDCVGGAYTFVKMPGAVEYARSSLGRVPDLADRIARDIDTDEIKRFIEENKADAGLKYGEVILSIGGMEGKSGGWLAYRPDGNLGVKITKEGISFSLKSEEEAEFFNRYYSASALEIILSFSRGCRFDKNQTYESANLGELDCENIYVPGEISDLASGPYPVYVGRPGNGVTRNVRDKSSSSVTGERGAEILSGLGENVSFALFTDGGECLYYIPYRAAARCRQFGGDVRINVYAEFSASEAQKRVLLSRLKDMCMEEDVSPSSCNIIRYVAGRGGYGGLCKEYTDKKIGDADNYEKKISVIAALKGSLGGLPGLADILSDTASRVYNEFISDTTLYNVGYKYQIVRPLGDILSVSAKTFVADVSRLFADRENMIFSFNALYNAGFADEVILSSINVVKPYAEMILKNEPMTMGAFARQFDVVRSYLWGLNELIGINSAEGLPKEDGYDAEAFLSGLTNLENAFEAIEKYADYAREEFDGIRQYFDVYRPIRDTLIVEKAAQSSPEEITEEYINGLINKAHIREAVCELFIKLQFSLASLLGADVKIGAVRLIETAFDEGIIDDRQKDELNRLRVCRNDYQHPHGKMRVKADAETLDTWKKLIFSLK